MYSRCIDDCSDDCINDYDCSDDVCFSRETESGCTADDVLGCSPQDNDSYSDVCDAYGQSLWWCQPGDAPLDTNYCAPVVTEMNGLRVLIDWMQREGRLPTQPLRTQVAAIGSIDQTVVDEAAFSEALRRAVRLAAGGAIVILGVQPDRPETGYGPSADPGAGPCAGTDLQDATPGAGPRAHRCEVHRSAQPSRGGRCPVGHSGGNQHSGSRGARRYRAGG